jgi:hypothetical protein
MIKKLVFCLFLIIVLSFSANAIDIDSCGTLDQAGQTYVLQNDVRSDATCFIITGIMAT